ncbi:MAG: hypothetical protein EP343_25025 [Deltaproteobacteria bacterium]|nr:MAG: hypothetical protein EP343_25025 [Deltaproteobacteria bacterium]
MMSHKTTLDPAKARKIRWTYGFLAAMMLEVGLITWGAFVWFLVKRSIPFLPVGEVGAYLFATIGSISLGLSWFAFRIAREPKLARHTGGPIAAGLVLMALARGIALVFGQELRQLLPMVLLTEVVLLCLLGFVVAWNSYTPKSTAPFIGYDDEEEPTEPSPQAV